MDEVVSDAILCEGFPQGRRESVREYNPEGEDPVTHRPVPDASHPAGAFRDRAADRAQEAARGIGGKEEALLAQDVIEVVKDHPRFDVNVVIHRVDLQDPLETLHVEDDAPLEDGGSGEARPRPSRDQGHASPGGDSQDETDFCLR